MATFKLSPIPRIPSPGARDFEAQIGNVLSHMPTLAAEIKDMAEATVEAAVLVDAEGNATIAATGASQAALSATSAVNASTKAAESLAAIKAEATKATKAKSAAELAASQAGINALAASDNAVRAETAAVAAAEASTTTATSIATTVATEVAAQVVGGMTTEASISAAAAAESQQLAAEALDALRVDAAALQAAVQALAQDAEANALAAADSASTASTAASTANNHAQQANLRAGSALSSQQLADAAAKRAADVAAGVQTLLDNLTAGPVVMVNGKFGAVHLVPSDIGLGNVDNTSDRDKPISTATQQALDGKEASGTTATALSAHTGSADPHSQYLPKAGGTMTGAITFAPAQTWPTFNQSTTGNAATATKLAAARSIDLTGAVTGKASFDGTQDVSIVTTIPTASAVSYTHDASGRVSTTTETLPTGTRTTTVTYNEPGQVKTVTVTLGTSTLTTTYSYDSNGVLTGTTSTES